MDKAQQTTPLKQVFTILVSQGDLSWLIPVFHNPDGSKWDYCNYFCKYGDIYTFLGRSSSLIPYGVYNVGEANTVNINQITMYSVSELYNHRKVHLMGGVVESLEEAIGKFAKGDITSSSEVPSVSADGPIPELTPIPTPTPTPTPTHLAESDYDNALAEIETLHGHTRNLSPPKYDLNYYSGKSGLYILVIHKTDDSPRFYKYGFCNDLCDEILDIMDEFRGKKYRIAIMNIIVADDKKSAKIMDKLDIWFKQFNCGSTHPTLGKISTADWTWRMGKYAEEIKSCDQ